MDPQIVQWNWQKRPTGGSYISRSKGVAAPMQKRQRSPRTLPRPWAFLLPLTSPAWIAWACRNLAQLAISASASEAAALN